MFSAIRAWLAAIFATGGETGHEEPELFVDAEGWLQGEGVVHYPSVRSLRLTSGQPIAIIWHYTATKVGTAKSLAKRIRNYKRGVDRAASWSLLIADDGTIYQSVSLLRGAWHCAKGIVGGYRVNACSVGIELEGMGDVFSPAQTAAAERVILAIADAYDITDRTRLAFDHSDFDPARRADAGPVWREHRREILDRHFPRA